MKEKIVKFVDNILPLNCHAVAFDSLNGMDCNSGAVYDYMIKNDDFEKTVQLIMAIIENEQRLESKK